jgi:hypothetical protein
MRWEGTEGQSLLPEDQGRSNNVHTWVDRAQTLS